MSEPSRQLVHDLTLKVVTPLFLGGASPTAAAELRPPSIKGVMRFWHRAAGPSAIKSEARLFGSSSGDHVGQSPFLLQAQPQTSDEIGSASWAPATKYLAYGIAGGGRNEGRRFIKPETDLRLRLVFRPSLGEDDRQKILNSIRLMSYFGGLGARSRRGLGSVMLTAEMPADIRALRTTIAGLLEQMELPNTDQAEYTMFSRRTRVLVLPGDKKWDATLLSIGAHLRNARTPKPAKPTGCAWALNDAHAMGKFVRTGSIGASPKRAAFGLPHNYYFGGTGAKASVGDDVRRGSPLFIHIHRLANGSHAAVVSFMPARFLPAGDKIVVKAGQYSAKVAPPDYQAVNGFLDYLVRMGAMEVSMPHERP